MNRNPVLATVENLGRGKKWSEDFSPEAIESGRFRVLAKSE
jgi:hypothetical protein